MIRIWCLVVLLHISRGYKKGLVVLFLYAGRSRRVFLEPDTAHLTVHVLYQKTGYNVRSFSL